MVEFTSNTNKNVKNVFTKNIIGKKLLKFDKAKK
jgi:hypothetical protein